ncbi:VWA domain-containing protein [Chloroflexi bacterium CFX6]|nr:VWA domain-containing protein [Chloroflexi bacterium CFX6]
MSFIWSSLLGSLIVVPLLALLYVWAQRRRRKYAAQFGLGLARAVKVEPASGGEERRRHVPALIFLFGIAILLFSLSRPQATISLPKYEGTVILVFDVSGSMAAEDIEPTRMEAAKRVASGFVMDQPSSVRVGAVAFSDGGLSVQPPDVNREATLTTIERLVPRRGTSLGNGILVALNAIAVDAGDPPILDTDVGDVFSMDEVLTAPQGWYPSAVIVLFSDGENNDRPDPLLVTDLAVDLGVRIYTIGIGSTEGATIKVEGMNIHTQMDEPLLQQIALESGGRYYYAGDESELQRIYNDLEPTLSIKPEELELTSLFAGVGILVFLLGGALSLLWFGRVV